MSQEVEEVHLQLGGMAGRSGGGGVNSRGQKSKVRRVELIKVVGGIW